MLNRAGLSMHDAYHVRPPWEVEALLMNQVAAAEASRRSADGGGGGAVDEEPLNPPDTPAPAWVDELDT